MPAGFKVQNWGNESRYMWIYTCTTANMKWLFMCNAIDCDG